MIDLKLFNNQQDSLRVSKSLFGSSSNLPSLSLESSDSLLSPLSSHCGCMLKEKK